MAVKRFPMIGAAAVLWAMSLATQERPIAQERRPVPIEHPAATFETADRCMACHNGLTDVAGEDVSIGVAWRASMMANSSRDPYWQAGVRRETMDHPSKKAAIEDECAICHMPMARFQAHAAGREGEVFSLAPALGGSSHEQRLAADGVSCMVCHQIGPDRLGTRQSFNGGFTVIAATSDGPAIAGPFEIDRGRVTIMRSATGASPVETEHLRRSEVCATCHTLFTQAFGPKGEVIGELPEQVPYQEWLHSAFAKERTCQSCHMPPAENTPIASVLGEAHDRRLDRHTFLGGNFFMLRMLNRFRGDLEVTALPGELDKAAEATLRQLREETATIDIARAEISAGRLEVDVVVRNLTGHKLPTAYPSRRAWLHFTVRDASGRTVFESGATAPDGRILGNDNDVDGSRFEPHYEQIRTADEVQIYESVMATPDGRVTTGLLQATQYVKDNRLLPRGFQKDTAPADVAVRGGASTDQDFSGGGDRVRYNIPVLEARRPFTIDAVVRYQPIGFRWASNLRSYDAPEPRRFVRYYDAMAASSSAVLARAAARTSTE